MNLFTWKRLDQHIGYLADKGVYTVGFQGFNIKRSWPVMPHRFKREKYDWYIRYSMARLAPFYNTVWNNTWESTNGASWLWENSPTKAWTPGPPPGQCRKRNRRFQRCDRKWSAIRKHRTSSNGALKITPVMAYGDQGQRAGALATNTSVTNAMSCGWR